MTRPRDEADEDAFPMPDIDTAGVDRSQIRRFLELTPLERVRHLESVLQSLERLRHDLAPARG